MVRQAVEKGSRHPLIAENLQPPAKLQVGGDEQASLQIALGKSLKKPPIFGGLFLGILASISGGAGGTRTLDLLTASL